MSQYSDMVIKNNRSMVDGVPRILVYFKGEYHLYEEGDHLNYFLHFLNKILHPLVELKEKIEIQLFANPHIEFIEGTPFYAKKYRAIDDVFSQFDKVSRAIAFVHDQFEHKEKIKQLEFVARSLAARSDLRVGIVTDKKLIKEFKGQYDAKWFDVSSNNTIVMITKGDNPNDPMQFYNLDKDQHEFGSWLNFVSLEDVEKFTPQAYQIVSLLDMPIFITFFKANFTQNKKSLEVYRTLKQVAYQFPPIMYMFTDEESYYHLKEKIGITWDNMPSMGLLNNEDMAPVVYPKDQKLSKENLIAFFDAFMDGSIFMKNFTLPELNKDFSQYFPNGFEVTHESYQSKLMDPNVDIMLLLYNSSENFYGTLESWKLSGFIDSVLHDLKANTVKVAYLDIAEGFLPNELKQEDQKFPSLQFLQANNRGNFPYKTIPDFKIQTILDFIRENAKTDVSKAFKTLDDEIIANQERLKSEKASQDFIKEDL